MDCEATPSFGNKFDPEVDDVAIKCMEAFLRYKAIYGRSLLTVSIFSGVIFMMPVVMYSITVYAFF